MGNPSVNRSGIGIAAVVPPDAPRNGRDLAREYLILLAAAGELEGRQLARFVAAVTERLDAGEATHGDRWRSMGAHRLLAEVREEAADIGGWGVLADQALDREGDQAARQALAEAIEAGALACTAIDRALDSLRREADAAK